MPGMGRLNLPTPVQGRRGGVREWDARFQIRSALLLAQLAHRSRSSCGQNQLFELPAFAISLLA